MRKLPILVAALILMGSCGKKEENDKDLAGAESEETTLISESGKSISGRSPWSNPVGRYNEVFNDSNYLQYAAAEVIGIDPIRSLADAYHTRRPLIKIESGENYVVDNLTHSMPFLVPEAATLLDEIGKEFGDIVEERGGDRSNKIVVTSVLRSPYSVRRLRRVNRNAVDSSTHMFATTFDISWSHFDVPDSTKAVDAVVLKGILAEVLLKKRNEGKCYVKFERKSPCFHITARQ